MLLCFRGSFWGGLELNLFSPFTAAFPRELVRTGTVAGFTSWAGLDEACPPPAALLVVDEIVAPALVLLSVLLMSSTNLLVRLSAAVLVSSAPWKLVY